MFLYNVGNLFKKKMELIWIIYLTIEMAWHHTLEAICVQRKKPAIWSFELLFMCFHLHFLSPLKSLSLSYTYTFVEFYTVYIIDVSSNVD